MNQSIDYLEKIATEVFNNPSDLPPQSPEADLVVCAGDLLALIKVARAGLVVFPREKNNSWRFEAALDNLRNALKEVFDE